MNTDTLREGLEKLARECGLPWVGEKWWLHWPSSAVLEVEIISLDIHAHEKDASIAMYGVKTARGLIYNAFPADLHATRAAAEAAKRGETHED
jgi:hypothetical protein